MAERPQRVAIGFRGGQVLSARMSVQTLEGLRKALDGGGWHELHTDEGIAHVNLAQVVYIRIDSEELRVGFGA